jgi:glutaredoxin
VPIAELAPRSGSRTRTRRGLTLIVGLCWLAGSAAAALWVWQHGVVEGSAASDDAAPFSLAAPPAPPVARAEPRALTEAEALRQVELAGDRSLQQQLAEQRAQRAALDQARQHTQTAEAARDAERKAEVAADIARQQQSAAQRGVEVVMYTTSWCGVCKTAKAYFIEHGVRYEERDIDTNPEWQQQCRVLNPRLSVPTIRIDNHMMVGFGAEAFEQHFERAAKERAQRQ